MKPLKLRIRLTLFYGAVFTLLLACASGLFYHVLVYQTDKDVRDELDERAAALRGYLRIESGSPQLLYDETDPEEAFFIGNATRYYQVYDIETGRIAARSQQFEALGFQYTPEEVREIARGPEFAGLETEQVKLLLHNDVVRSIDGRPFLVQVGTPLGPRQEVLHRMLRSILWMLPSGVALALVSGWWISGRVLSPISALSTAAEEMSISHLHRRLPLRGTDDELDRLAGAFNGMFGRLEVAVQQMKDFTAGISHELRTPLTVLRGEAEIALAQARTTVDYRNALESQLEEFGKLSRIIDQMLTLARAEAGQIRLGHDGVDLGALATSIAGHLEALAESRSIALTCRSPEGVRIQGDAGWLERAVLNLLDNALKYTAPGGSVEIEVAADKENAVLEVRDNGMGIPEEALPHIFERFFRADPSRGEAPEGAGLGLTLVEWIVSQHGGTVAAESIPGRGTTFRIALPAGNRECRIKPEIIRG